MLMKLTYIFDLLNRLIYLDFCKIEECQNVVAILLFKQLVILIIEVERTFCPDSREIEV